MRPPGGGIGIRSSYMTLPQGGGVMGLTWDWHGTAVPWEVDETGMGPP